MTMTSSMTITKSNPNGVAPVDDTKGEEEPAKKGRLLKVVVLVVAVLAIGYLAYAMLIGPMLNPVRYKAGQPVPSGATLDLEGGNGGTAFNLADNGHEVSLDPVLQLTSVADTTAMTNDVPQFLNAVVSVLNTTTDEQITQQTPLAINGVTYPNGEEAARGEILAAVQKIAGTVDGDAQQVSAVYFTNFVTQ